MGDSLFNHFMNTGNTNGSCYEVFTLLGKVYGSRLLLGYVLIKTDNPAQNAKEHCPQQFHQYFIKTWNVHTIATLSNKN